MSILLNLFNFSLIIHTVFFIATIRYFSEITSQQLLLIANALLWEKIVRMIKNKFFNQEKTSHPKRHSGTLLWALITGQLKVLAILLLFSP